MHLFFSVNRYLYIFFYIYISSFFILHRYWSGKQTVRGVRGIRFSQKSKNIKLPFAGLPLTFYVRKQIEKRSNWTWIMYTVKNAEKFFYAQKKRLKFKIVSINRLLQFHRNSPIEKFALLYIIPEYEENLEKYRVKVHIVNNFLLIFTNHQIYCYA